MEQEVKEKIGAEKLREIAVKQRIDIAHPMELSYDDGYITYNVFVNGIEESDLNDTERRAVIQRVMRYYKNNPSKLRDLLQFFIKHEEYEICEKNFTQLGTFKIKI